MEVGQNLFARLAESQNVALALSLLINGLLGRSLVKLYHSKEDLHKQVVGILREIIPLAVRLRDKIDELNG